MFRVFVKERTKKDFDQNGNETVLLLHVYDILNYNDNSSLVKEYLEGFLQEKYVYEMPQADVLRIFGDKAHLAGNQNCQVTRLENSANPDFPFDVVFTPPQAGITVLRDLKKKEAEAALTAKIDEITPYYPDDEKASFDVQEKEANLYAANPDASFEEISYISSLAKGRQIPVSVLSEKILAKAKSFKIYSGYYTGLKQRIEDLADKAQTEEEINAIDVAAIFAEPLE